MNRRETTTKLVEYVLEPTESGVNHAEVSKAITIAANEYWQATGTAPGGPLPDDVIWFNVDKVTGELVVSFELTRRG